MTVLRKTGISLPPIETVEGLTAQGILDKINSFYGRFEDYTGETADYAEGYFLELLRDYPVSLCSRNMSESLAQLIAICYFESRPEQQDSRLDDPWPGYSYEDLAVIFDRSKATIHEAIRQQETQVRLLLSEAKLRKEARSIALAQLVEEEKKKLQEQNRETINQMNERAPEAP